MAFPFLGNIPLHPFAISPSVTLSPDDRPGYVKSLEDESKAQSRSHLEEGIRLAQIGRLQQAVVSLQTALKLDPTNADGHFHLGLVCLSLGQHESSAICFQNVLHFRPQSPDAYNQLGNSKADLGDLAAAKACYEMAISLRPDYFDAYNNLGVVLLAQGSATEAIKAFRFALSRDPKFAEAHNNLGNALKRIGKIEDAIESYGMAARCNPKFAGASYNMGVALYERGLLSKAHASLVKATTISPGYADAHNQAGIVLLSMGMVEESAECVRRALSVNPRHAIACSNSCAITQYQPDVEPGAKFSVHRGYANTFEEPLRAGWGTHLNDRRCDRKLRIGYVSQDFRHHSVAYFIEPVIENHDKERFEVFCYYNHTWKDRFTERIRANADTWVECASLSDEILAQRIRDDRIDILVDLGGHTAGNRLLTFARKPAPVQVTYLGYPGTTGLDAIDFRLTDSNLDPVGLTEQFHSERLVRIPVYAPFLPDSNSPPVGDLPALTSGFFTFSCLNNLAKINPRVISLWARILQRVPAARLMLGNASDETVRKRLWQLFEDFGVSKDRVVLKPSLPVKGFLELHHEIDLALDPFPWNGGTTTNHSLHMGVPVVTLAGDLPAGRLGVATMMCAGLPEFVARDEDEYVEIAVRFASDRTNLSQIRRELRHRISADPRNDPRNITRDIEAAFCQMWADRRECG